LGQDHLDPTDLGVAGKSVEDMEDAEETEEDLKDLEGLEDLAGPAVVGLSGEQEQELVLVEDEIRSEKTARIVSMMYTDYSTVEKGNPRHSNQKEGNGNLHMGFALSEYEGKFISEILHHLSACAFGRHVQAVIPLDWIEKINLLRELQDHWAPVGAWSLSQPEPPRFSDPSHRSRGRQCTRRRHLKVAFLHRDCSFALLYRMTRRFQARPLMFQNLSREECQRICASR